MTKRVRVFLGLDGDLNPNARMFTLKLLNKVRLDNPHSKIVVCTDNPTMGCFVQKQTGFAVSDFLDGEFDRAYIITDKENDEVGVDAEGEPLYEFSPKVIRIRDGRVIAPPPMQVRPDPLCHLKPSEPKKPFNWADHYTDFIDAVKDTRQYIPLTLTPDLPMPKTWSINVEGF